MTFDTINDAVTIAGNSTGTMLANRYRVVRQLGSGGMGNVWLVEDVKLDNKLFAVKMLPAILVSNRRAYEQVKSEALIALKLVHPNIVQFRALEETAAGGNPFLVMDYIDGRTLDDYLAEKGKLTEDETLRVLRPIAAALDYAHEKGVVHRDVKPGNVMIAKDGTPYILDFGIAREIQETMTRVTGKFSSGTLMYMSPEQNNGDEPTPAQDVYSFAAMAYECLAGKPPFTRGNIEYQIMNTAPAPLTGNAAILAAGVMAGLAKKPEDRPATCMAVLEGDGFSRKERKERKEAGAPIRWSILHLIRRHVATETGVSRLVATIRGALAASLGRAGAPRPPQRDKIVRTEHVERVEGKAPDGGKRKISRRKIVIGLVTILGLVVVGGVWCGLTREKKVQLWEDGPYWADRNIGAEKSEDYGYYFWWGDTVGYKRQGDAWEASDGSKTNFSFKETLFSSEDKNIPTYTKEIAELRKKGWITSDNILAPEHDAAHIHWGGNWRMPTDRELKDLEEKCDWTRVTRNGVAGYLVSGKGAYASASIFLPAAGRGDGTSLSDVGSRGYYWSSVPDSDNGRSDYAYGLILFFGSNVSFLEYFGRCYNRYLGQSVRPVQE